MSTEPKYPLRFAARATIEFETPFIIGGGGDDLFFDDVFVADANGLPTLPGSSLAGILRHAWRDAGIGDDKDLFGFQEGDQGRGSRLSVSWGCIHDAANRPVEGIIIDREMIASDAVLSEARLLTARDHVRINDKGTAGKNGKFDERSVSAGHRFTFELLLEGKEGDEKEWNNLLSLLRYSSIRIGGKTRRGYGQFRLVALLADCFDLRKEKEFRDFLKLPVSLAVKTSLPDGLGGIDVPESDAVTATLALKPEGFWMFGGGFDDSGNPGDRVDMAPLKANRIVWENDGGTVKYNRALVPGSSVKGAIAHRVAFHYNRLKGVFAGEKVNPEDHTGENNEAVKALFGFRKGRNDEAGRRGKVIISDIFVSEPGEQKILNHVSIDRFTGGARTLDGALFDEKPYYGGEGFTLQVTVAKASAIVDARIRQALEAALKDLAEGRLALGAGAGRGNGYFRADGGVQWNDTGRKWMAGGVK